MIPSTVGVLGILGWGMSGFKPGHFLVQQVFVEGTVDLGIQCAVLGLELLATLTTHFHI